MIGFLKTINTPVETYLDKETIEEIDIQIKNGLNKQMYHKKYPVRDYLSVEISIFHHIRHAVGMPPHISLVASLRDAVAMWRFLYREIHSYGMFQQSAMVSANINSLVDDKTNKLKFNGL